MEKYRYQKWAIPLILITMLVLSSCLFSSVPAKADGGIAISGSFYRQPFELPQGANISGPSIYVVVFNNGDTELNVRMITEAPRGVGVILSHDDFTIDPGGQRKVLIILEASEDAPAGEHEIRVTAESYSENEGGIQIMGAAGQTATVIVTGESAFIIAKTVSPSGDPIPAVIRLMKITSDATEAEFDYSETGTLETTVSPGNFIAQAYVSGEKLAEESFYVADGDEKTVVLIIKTVYFANFGVVPHYHSSTGQLAFTKLIYMIENLYKPMSDAEMLLLVMHEGVSLEEISIGTISTLDIGSMEQSYNYIPPDGWINGHYTFQMQLNLGGEPYTYSAIESLDIEGIVVVEDVKVDEEKGSSNTALIIGVAISILVVIAIASILFLHRRRSTRRKRYRIPRLP